MGAKGFVAAVTRLNAIVVAFILIGASLAAGAQAADAPRRVGVVSFGLFGAQDVFGSEATEAAKIVASRFGGNPVIVQYNTKEGGKATVTGLEATLQATAEKLNHERDILFLILTSHGSRNGLAVVAGWVQVTAPPGGLRAKVYRAGGPPHGSALLASDFGPLMLIL